MRDPKGDPGVPGEGSTEEGVLAGQGLCAACANARIVISARGATFVFCGLSRTDGRFAKYPRLPVLACVGFESAAPSPRGTQGHQR